MIYRTLKKITQGALLLVLTTYSKYLSYFLPPSCRFYPSCSCYAHDAIKTHGAGRGSYLAARRLLRCHPWHPGGFDPVPTLDSHLQKPLSQKPNSRGTYI